ncbi:RNA helicase aquarius-like [Saccostrea cucullata]|uniref:RNA helicase aquarius-like n=1 Tax=Saccostrea cuccullata TaxID=36930 RepID=UPI002ED16BAA
MSTATEGDKTKRGNKALTVEQIQEDSITQLASQHWSKQALENGVPFKTEIVEKVFQEELLASKFSTKRTMLLEFSQYLENYLWPNFSKEKGHAHTLSIILMVNEKFRERVPPWECFKQHPERFCDFMFNTLETCLDQRTSLRELSVSLVFLIHCFNSLEVDLIREQVQKLVSLPIWSNILQGKRDEIFQNNPKYRKFFNLIKKNDAKLSEEQMKRVTFERGFLYNMIKKFLGILDTVPLKGDVAGTKINFCERFLELMIDIEAQLPTRRFFNVLLEDCHLVVKCQLSNLSKRSEGKLFGQLLEMLKSYTEFEIDDITGEALTLHDRIDIHYDRVLQLQKVAFKHFPELHKFAIANVASVDTRAALSKYFKSLSNVDLHKILAHIHQLPAVERDEDCVSDVDYLMELLISRHERQKSQQERVNEMPLYPTEKIIWDENIVPVEYFSGEGCLALPKLNLQFLTLHDYLLKNFDLFRLESTYEIRQDIEDSGSHLKPWQSEDGSCLFGGWARMAQPIVGFNVVEVAKPRVGETHPAQVRADVTINLSVRPQIKKEWEDLRKHDVAFLITLRPTVPIHHKYNFREPFIPQVGLTFVRGCEVEGMLDMEGKVIEEGPEPKPFIPGDIRTFRVWLDPNQYQQDMTKTMDGEEDVYETFNVIMRRKPKENNFKAVLETIRDLMNTECVVPDWLHDLILGYGQPDAAHYSKMSNTIETLDWNDTFLNINHLKASFPGHEFEVTTDDISKQIPPFKLTFPKQQESTTGKRKAAEEEPSAPKKIIVQPHVIENRGPYPYNQPKKNQIPFTPTQIEAVRSGMQPGLTMVVGPPGTGKTDVAVQIISNIYHNFPEQRTLIVTHSNQALNQLFEKIMALDIDERHLLRLGHGEEALETEKDFSRYGRVNYVLAQRLELLEEVARLQNSLDVKGDMSYTCETASYFYLYQVLARWEEYQSKLRNQKEKTVEIIKDEFPFTKYFENAPQPIFKGKSYTEDIDMAEGCFRHIKKIFTQLEEFRAFELLRSGADRAEYLLIKEAKIIAMTCTHAALKRRDLVSIGFKFDNILMEESAQILEIETFIPLLLQNPEDNNNRLKRWIMIGDHHQLPPVIKNMAFQKFCNMEQSLFTRLVRLGVPTIDLDAQGRARPGIASLYNWRYKKLGSLSHVMVNPEYKKANAGFVFEYQLIDVQDFNGVGESEPNPFFYQNLAEAEYVVATFMYMRLLGYPAEKISILTTYNGQKHLIRDVIKQRCGRNQFIGTPHKVTTVDRYQGQQNDYILLSLVRTKTVGHLRDVRRLVVAMSRARLGLYVFARVSLFSNCFELTPTFNKLMSRPLQLHILPSEVYPPTRKMHEQIRGEAMVMKNMPHMAQFVFDFYNQKINRLMSQSEGGRQPKDEPLEEPPKSEQPMETQKIPTKMEEDNSS